MHDGDLGADGFMLVETAYGVYMHDAGDAVDGEVLPGALELRFSGCVRGTVLGKGLCECPLEATCPGAQHEPTVSSGGDFLLQRPFRRSDIRP